MGRASAFRDLGVAIFIVAGILGGIYVWSGVWPPMVVIESSSMMHDASDVPYGRLGTIDPGDMVFVKSLDPYANDGRGDVDLEGDGPVRYGKSGDVIVFYRDGIRTRGDGTPAIPIIHRAVAWVDVVGSGPNRTYEVLYKGDVLRFNSTGITIGDLRLTAYQPVHGGYITKGDNPRTNPAADQAGLASQPSKPEWVTGKARAEIPWFGLIKLTIGDELKNPPGSGEPQAIYWVRVGNVYAPSDLWVMLASSLVAIVLVPLAWDVLRAARERRAEERAFEPVRVRAPPRMRVRPIPPPGDGPSRLARFEVVRPGERGAFPPTRSTEGE